MSQSFKFLPGSLALENRPYHLEVSKVIQSAFGACEGYFGYKLTSLGRASDTDVPSFLIVTKEHGVVLVDVVEEQIDSTTESDEGEFWVTSTGDQLTARSLVLEMYEEEVRSRLRNDLSLYDRKTREIKTPIRSAVVFCENDQDDIESWYSKFGTYDSDALSVGMLPSWLNSLDRNYNCTTEELNKLFALLEGTFIYESKPAVAVDAPLISVNDYIQRSLRTTFKQDDAQRLASMQLPPGPQRIRGLAGTGKTIVLSLKAAISHKRFPEFRILYLFNTQSLYLHVQSLIAKYYTLEAKKAPDFDYHLSVMHAWGGRSRPGLYSTLCNKHGLIPLTLADARGKGDALEFIYKDLLQRIGSKIEPEYDLILVDEAQDFPNEVFEVVFKLAKGNASEKRIVWAYDEFQSLRDTEIKGPSALFGKNAAGAPNLPDSVLDGTYPGDIPKDFVLPNCYRTPRPVLMTAHGVALGLYTSRPNEMFYHPAEWQALGYRVNEPKSLKIAAGDNVEIERPDENSRNLLENLLMQNKKNPRHLVQCEGFGSNEEQINYVATTVKRLIDTENVAPEEIIIVNLKSGNNKDSMLDVQRVLMAHGVRSVLPGYVESADVFKPKGSVTITTPFRAKGNEANIVFVINAQQVVRDFTLRMRNAFFVAVTRSRGWCHITGHGEAFQLIASEIQSIKQDLPKFKFVCPDPEQVKSSKSFLNKSDKELDKIQELLEFVDKNPEVRKLLSERLK